MTNPKIRLTHLLVQGRREYNKIVEKRKAFHVYLAQEALKSILQDIKNLRSEDEHPSYVHFSYMGINFVMAHHEETVNYHESWHIEVEQFIYSHQIGFGRPGEDLCLKVAKAANKYRHLPGYFLFHREMWTWEDFKEFLATCLGVTYVPASQRQVADIHLVSERPEDASSRE